MVLGLGSVLALNRGLIAAGGGALTPLLWLIALALVGIAIAGALWVGALAEPGGNLALLAPRLPWVKLSLDIIVPGLLAAGFVVFLQLFESGSLQAVIVLLAGLSFAGVLWAQAHSRDTTNRYFALAQSALNVIAHLTAFLLFSVIYGVKVRALYSATAVGVVCALLLYELLSRDAAWHEAMHLPVEGRRATITLLSMAGGLIAGELTWGLNYWAALSTLVGGAFLLVVFYVIHGIASHYVNHTLTRQVFVEFGLVGALGLAVIFASAFLQ
jgi:intracellular septation protein A